ncbi:MAG: efflux RND transporter periplasmic adaptor subunit [Gemmatimonadota bacterium]|nr:efflux RND transporter periplasmic adaptor subunit [Gemmatimonadota bacterium]
MSKRFLLPGLLFVVTIVVIAIVRTDRLAVTVVTATRDTLSVTIPAEGRTRPRERFMVAAPISGRLTRLDLEEGQRVQEGELLARLYAAPQDPRIVASARAEVSAAEARHREAESVLREVEVQARQARREVERRRPLAEMGAITAERMEQAELAAEVAEERLQAAEASVASAQAALDSARARLVGAESADETGSAVDVLAPVTGRVLQVPDESARIVPAGTPLVVLADIGGLEVVMDILSEDAVRVEPGNDIVISTWGGEGPLTGTVRNVTLVGYTKISALGVEEQRVDVIGDLRDAPPSLGTGYRVSGDIVVWRGSDVLSVPTSALFRVGQQWQLFVDEGGRARARTVIVGQRNENAAEILDGVTEGEQVVVFPPDAIEDGVSIRPQPASG